MKKILIATIIVGAAVAGVLLYMREQLLEDLDDDDVVTDAANSAYRTMNRNIGRVERTFDHALN